ncbi:MAG: N-acetyltransferase [Conexibacter sp.]|nr:N-acetyltransferase [Conexibacter sp.]
MLAGGRRRVRPLRDGVHIERWGEGDHALLSALNGDPAQMRHVGGAESAEKIAERQARYARDPGQLRIVDAGGASAGWVGFWAREWRGERVYEIGWSVLPAFQGRGLASAGTALALEAAAAVEALPVHAFPSVENGASNAVCRRLGFVLVEADMAFEYPPGTKMVCNDWRREP